jgi:hypothetical protein
VLSAQALIVLTNKKEKHMVQYHSRTYSVIAQYKKPPQKQLLSKATKPKFEKWNNNKKERTTLCKAKSKSSGKPNNR